MDRAQVLLRTVTRAFYEPQHCIIVEGLVRHSALTTPELKGFFQNAANRKNDLTSWCAELERSGLISKCTLSPMILITFEYANHILDVRAEPKSKGARGAVSTTFYYVDYRRMVDSVKYRLHTLEAKITKHSKPSAEKKPYKCPRCKSEFTQLDLMDSIDPLGRGSGFKCKTCGEVIPPPVRQGKGGDTMIGLFNKQFLPIINLLREIDSVVIPEVNAEQAVAAAIPVRKKNDGPQYQKTEFEIEDEQIRPTAVKGITPAAEKIEISITTDRENNAATRAAEQERRIQIAAQNKVPEWYSKSTVTGEAVKVGQSSTDAPTSSVSVNGVTSGGDEKKLDKEEMETLDDFFKALKEQQEREQEQQEEDDEDDDDDDDEFEDINVANGSTDGKRPFEDDSASNAASTPGAKKLKTDASAGTSAVGTPAGRSESDADDDEFEEVKM